MKNAIILHGVSETKESFWYPWLTQELEKKGYSVSIPALPEKDDPDIKNWLPAALKEIYTPETVLISHSAGGAIVLAVLENLTVQIKQAILVAGYCLQKPNVTRPTKVIKENYDWEKIASHAEEFLFLNSDNDPWGCTPDEGQYMLDNIGRGKLIVMKNEGHMGSDMYDQPYKEFPFLLKLIA